MTTISEIHEIIDYPIIGVIPSGSRIICSPAPTDTDEDWLVRVAHGDIQSVCDSLLSQGFEFAGSMIGSEQKVSLTLDFWSFIRGTLNLIITTNINFFSKFHLATKICTTMNVLSKRDRVMIFEALIHGTYVDMDLQIEQSEIKLGMELEAGSGDK